MCKIIKTAYDDANIFSNRLNLYREAHPKCFDEWGHCTNAIACGTCPHWTQVKGTSTRGSCRENRRPWGCKTTDTHTCHQEIRQYFKDRCWECGEKNNVQKVLFLDKIHPRGSTCFLCKECLNFARKGSRRVTISFRKSHPRGKPDTKIKTIYDADGSFKRSIYKILREYFEDGSSIFKFIEEKEKK